MSRANPLWGAPRIHGELLKLGIVVAQSTLAKYLRRRRKPPSQTWRTFLTQLSGYGVRRELIEFFVEDVRSIEEVNIDTLADRMEAQARAVDPQWVSARYISAWARKP